MSIKQKAITQLVMLYRKLPFKPFNGMLRDAYYRFLKANTQNRTAVKNVNGINYELDLTEVIDSAIYYSQNREPHTAKALNRLCKPGSVVFDIGANIGSHTLPIAKSIGSTGKVYAFEPVPWAVDKLKKNLSLNNFNNVYIQPIALSDYIDDNAEFSLRASFKTSSEKPVNEDGNLNNNWWDACEKVKVKVETLDSFVSREKIAAIDVIKLDVDGFEAKVFRGAKNTIQHFKPAIVMELAPSWLTAKGDSAEILIKLLSDYGYSFFNEDTFEKIPDILVQAAKLKAGYGINLVCLYDNHN